ncbi:MAG: hypothetical protein HY817_01225 [Candidatus Abawacabacteria bacterium]|nr:hypothetical protein [Candidatus Abawacabacteria bacterium]
MIEIAASLQAANPLDIAAELTSIEGLVDRLHLDIMDGHMVPNLALSTDLVRAIPDTWQRDLHLMVEKPDVVAEWLDLRAGDTLYFHPYAISSPEKLVSSLTDRGVIPGFAINLEYDLPANFATLALVDHFLVMGITPGFSGKHMDEKTTSRIQWLRERFPQATIAVDGGVNDKNALNLIRVGANILVVGSYLFSTADRKVAIDHIRDISL